jgi:hypothetical protein
VYCKRCSRVEAEGASGEVIGNQIVWVYHTKELVTKVGQLREADN